jgi:hypothetical protein
MKNHHSIWVQEIFFTAFILVVLLAGGCGEPQGGPPAALSRGIVGTWQATDRPFTIEFFPNGSIRMTTIGPAKTGSYRLDSMGTLMIQLEDGKRLQSTARVTGEQLTLTDADGPLFFKRMN